MVTDNIMTRAWAEVHKGTDRTDEQVLQDFGALYAQDMYSLQEHNITGITMQQLRDAFSNVKKNATGPDAWDHVTLSRLADTPLRSLTRMLNGIEKGIDWPRHITKAHATCTPKENRASHDPLLPPSLQSAPHHVTDPHEMGLRNVCHRCTPVPGQGAEQGWWQLFLKTVRATDIYKCVDQVGDHSDS